MDAVTYGVNRVAAPAVAAAKTGTKAKGRSFFVRVVDAIAYSQMKRAEREFARYRHLLPHNFEMNGGKVSPFSKDQLPFGGW